MHTLAFDSLLAVVLAVIGAISHLTVRGEGISAPSGWGVALALAASLPLVARRRYPVSTLVLVLAAQFALEAMNAVGPGWLGVMIAAYSLGAYRNGRMMWIVGGATWLVLTLFVVLGVLAEDAQWGELLSTGVIYASSIALGDNIRRRRERAAELIERAERAEREQELLAHQQVQHERVRIARELHDVVAHSVSVMVIQAAAARRQLATNPAAAEEVLLMIEQTGRDAMTEMRRMLGVLRNEIPDAEFQPQPSLGMLPHLVGADVDLPTRLQLLGDLESLPAGVELSAYRIVQEALTNVRRHAGRVELVMVTIERRAGELLVEILDDGRGAVGALSAASAYAGAVHGAAAPAAVGQSPTAPPAHLGSWSVPGPQGGQPLGDERSRGFGLVGMRERVAAFDGDLTVGPRPGGGWRVQAVFPLATLDSSTARAERQP